jgi:hypothetical protein
MEIKKRPLNKGEYFPCSFSQAKAIFQNTDVFLDFAYLGRCYSAFQNTQEGFYLKNKIKGYVVLSMHMEPKYPRPILSFYVVNDKVFNPHLQDEIVNKYLPEFYSFYQMQAQSPLMDGKNLMLLEVIDGTLKLHKVKTE